MKKTWCAMAWGLGSSLSGISSLHACAVCFGDSNSLAVKSMSNGIFTLLACVVFFWVVGAAFFIYLWMKPEQSHS